MAVKHISTDEIHKGRKGETTGCGSDTTKHPEHWTNTSGKITCGKNGCKD